jgi:hypothetical protein
MEAHRQIVYIKNRTLNILLPDKFKNDKIDIIGYIIFLYFYV